jgi:hypothetical protein
MAHLLSDPDWVYLKPCFTIRNKRGLDITLPPELVKIALAIRAHCVACGRRIAPIRIRDLETYDKRWAHLGPHYYSGTCSEKIRRSCSRTSAASKDIDRMLAAIRGEKYTLPTERLDFEEDDEE